MCRVDSCASERTKKRMLPFVSSDKELARIQIPQETRLILSISVNILFQNPSQDQKYLKTSKEGFAQE